MSNKTSKPDSSKAKPLPSQAFDKLYWLRMVLGVVAGILADQVFLGDLYNGILIAVMVYLASFYIAKYGWYKGISTQYTTKLYTTGLLGYVGFFLLSWILIFTLPVQ